MTTKIPVDGDISAFFEHTKWLITVTGMRADVLLELLSARFKSRLPFLREHLHVEDKALIAGERRLCELLASRFTHRRLRVAWGHQPGRQVDWCRSYLEQTMRGVGCYANLVDAEVPDRVIHGALLGLAHRWKALLGLVPKTSERELRRKALETAISNSSLPTVPWTQAAAKRLHSSHPEAATEIGRALQVWQNLSGERLARTFGLWLDEYSGEKWTPSNRNDLLEWTAALAIARCASESGWKLHRPQSLVATKGYPDLNFSRFDDDLQTKWRFRISKGRPRNGYPEPDFLPGAAGDDLLSQLIKATGNGATGGEPDIVLTFWRSDDPARCVTLLGDAKRNASGTGTGYLAASIGKALSYVTTYSQLLDVQPQCTLFLLKGVKEVLGEVAPESIAERIRNGETLPTVFCLALEHWAVPLHSSESPLKAWLDQITKKALCQLGEVSKPDSQQTGPY